MLTPPGRSLATLLTLGLLASLVLAGCSDEPAAPQTAPTTPTTPVVSSPSEASTPTPPALPDEARGTTAASAKAFVRHWIATLNYAVATGDVAGLRDVSSPTCSSCTALIDFVETTYEGGGYVKSDGWRLRSATVVPAPDSQTTVLVLSVRQTSQVVRPDAGSPEETFDGGIQPFSVTLKRQGAAWLVDRLVREG